MDADLIRLVLLILGVALVAGIWLWDHWQRRKGEPPMAHSEAEPDTPPASQWDEPELSDEEPVEAHLEEQHAEAEPGLYVTSEVDEVDEQLPPVEHRPAWVQPDEPVIPAFVMNSESEPLPGEQDEEPTIGPPISSVPGTEEAKPSPTVAEPTVARVAELLHQPQPQPRPKAPGPETPAVEPRLVADTGSEPEIPVLELEAEPIHAPARPAHTKSRETAPKPKPKPEAEPVSIRPDDEQFDLDLGFSAVDEQDLEELAAELPQLIVQINIVARAGLFSGEQILAAMEQVEMQAGEHNIFHRRDNRGRGGKPKVLFSLASMVEPGSFPLKKMKDFTTPGLTLFTQLPGPRDGLLVYSDMLYVAERLARLLDARLKDEQRSTLTKQTIEHTRERIAEHKRQITLKLRQAGDQHRGRR